MARFIRINERVLNLDAILMCQPIANELGMATGVRLVFPLPLGTLDLFGARAEAFFEDLLARLSPEEVAAGDGLDVAGPVPVQPAPAEPVRLDYQERHPRGAG